MTDSDLEAEFRLGWASFESGEASPGRTSPKKSSRLAKESQEKRERRLRQARECSARRRSMETPEQREKRLKEQRERMAMKRRLETAEMRDLRLQKAREREFERRCCETPDQRERRLKYSKEKAAIRREMETIEQREKRLGTSRMRAAQRRKGKRDGSESQTISDSEFLLEQSLPHSEPDPATPSPEASKPVRATRQSIKNAATCSHTQPPQLAAAINTTAEDSPVNYNCPIDLGTSEPWSPLTVTSTFSSGDCIETEPLPPGDSQPRSTDAPPMLVGTGFFERRCYHPDFRYSMEGPPRLMCGIHPIAMNGERGVNQ